MNLKTDQQKISNLKNKKIKERGKLTMLQGQRKKHTGQTDGTISSSLTYRQLESQEQGQIKQSRKHIRSNGLKFSNFVRHIDLLT